MPFKVAVIDQLRQHVLHKRGNGAGVKAELLLIHLDKMKGEHHTTLNPALDKKDVLINGVMGLCGESGETIDIVKKWLAQGHELNRERILSELGDIAWYLAEVAYALDTPLEEVLIGNIEKLKARYPEGFDTEKSKNRDKNDL